MNKLFSLLISILLVIPGLAQRTIIHCGSLIDGVSMSPKKQMSVVIKGNKIISVEQGFIKAGKKDELIDLSDQTVMPGLMDMHVHLEGEANPKSYIERFTLNEADVAFRSTIYARRTLMAGFTTVRDLGGTGVNIAMRKAINAGYILGPRVFTAGKIISTTGGHGDPTNGMKHELMGDPGPVDGVINSPDEARKAVRERYKEGSDVIKITATGGVLSVDKDGKGPHFTEEEIRAVVETANDYGMITAAHAHGAEGMKRAVEAGITSIEHGTFMTPEIMELMKKKGTYYVPTISAGMYVAKMAKVKGFYPDIIVPKALEIGPQIQDTFSNAYKAGVKIAFGTDAGVYPHGQNAKEFGYMVDGGMKPMEAIQAATSVAASLLKMSDKLGSISEGKWADIVATKGNPLSDIHVLEHISFVMKNGVVYKGGE